MPSTEPIAGPRQGGRTLLRLTAGLAHTVNNALTGTLGYLELAQRQCRPGSQALDDIRAAIACAHRAAESLRELIAFATAPARVSCVPVSLRDVAANAAGQARACAAAGVEVVVSGERAAMVVGQPALLVAAVELVVRNALEAMPAGGRLTIESEEVGGRCRLWIRDSGPGIPSEVRDRLFEPFVTTKPFGHLGLGLALASELARAQDGTLTLSSSEGIGTTVVFALPACAAVTSDARAAQHNDGRHVAFAS